MNRNKLLFGFALIVWFGVTAGRFVDARQAGAQQPPAQTPPAQTPPAQTPPAQAPPTHVASGLRRHGYLRRLSRARGKEHHALAARAGQGSSLAGRHARLRELSWSGPGARRRRREGANQEIQRAEARRGQRDLSHLPQPRHARGLGSQRPRRAESLVHHVPQRAHAASRSRASWSSRPRRRCAPPAIACRS